MASQAFPTFGISGWVNDPYSKADYIMASFFTTNYSQSREWYGKLVSLPYLLQSSSNDPSTLQSSISNGLTELFNAYFDSCNVEVSVVDGTADDTGSESLLNIIVRVSFSQNNVRMSLGKALSAVNGALSSVRDLERGR